MPPARKELLGYAWLNLRFGLDLPQPARRLLIRTGGKADLPPGEATLLPESALSSRVGSMDEIARHLRLALKHEPVDPLYWQALSRTPAVRQSVTQWADTQRTSRYARQAWFLVEWFSGSPLPLKSLGAGIPLVRAADPGRQLTVPDDQAGVSARHRVRANLPGTPAFCPLVRMTPEVQAALAMDLHGMIDEVRSQYSERDLVRATNYLYHKESRSSFEIEHERAPDRIERFVSTLRNAGQIDVWSEEGQLDFQSGILDPRGLRISGIAPGWRNPHAHPSEVYVGETRSRRIHHLGAPASALHGLMKDWARSIQEMHNQGLPPVARAAIAAFSFVYLHPLHDGNGRLHRFLIHQVLVEDRAVPPRFILPVSAVMLSHAREYDETLESVSRVLLRHQEYQLDHEGALHFVRPRPEFYRYYDATHNVGYLGAALKASLQEELLRELAWLRGYDQAAPAIQQVIDLTERATATLISQILDNGGHLPNRRRKRQYKLLSDEEVRQIEQIVSEAFELPESPETFDFTEPHTP